MCGSEGRLVEPVLGEQLKGDQQERRGSAGWEGRGQSKSPALLQCKLAENADAWLGAQAIRGA